MRATRPLGLGGFLMIALVGCAESPTGISEPIIPVEPSTLGVLRAVVDLDRGTLDFSPVPSGALPGLSPSIYGNQAVNVRLYNTPVSVDSSTSTWRWSANVGVRNLRPHSIGDEEAGVAPLDTIGVFVFFVQEPVLGVPCGGCFVRIANYQGTLNLDAPGRKYFHWPEQLNAMGSPLGDTTRVRRTWVFETSPGVRSFSFNVLIAAAWPAPHESRWKVEYTADLLPGLSAPGWKTQIWGSGATANAAGGSLSLRGNNNSLSMFYRRDPIASSQDAYIDAVARLNGGSSRPEVALILSDHVRLMGLGIANGTVGLISGTGLFIPGTTASLTNGVHEFQLRKYAADSIVYFVDGVRRGRAAYASLSVDDLTPASGAFIAFGSLPTSGGNNSTWDNVVYEIGAASP